jgi:hypothetical protein
VSMQTIGTCHRWKPWVWRACGKQSTSCCTLVGNTWSGHLGCLSGHRLHIAVCCLKKYNVPHMFTLCSVNLWDSYVNFRLSC